MEKMIQTFKSTFNVNKFKKCLPDLAGKMFSHVLMALKGTQLLNLWTQFHYSLSFLFFWSPVLSYDVINLNSGSPKKSYDLLWIRWHLFIFFFLFFFFISGPPIWPINIVLNEQRKEKKRKEKKQKITIMCFTGNMKNRTSFCIVPGYFLFFFSNFPHCNVLPAPSSYWKPEKHKHRHFSTQYTVYSSVHRSTLTIATDRTRKS